MSSGPLFPYGDRAYYPMEINHMRSFRSLILGATLALVALAPIAASAQSIVARQPYVANEYVMGVTNLSNTSYTNATTTATVLTGTPITVPITAIDYTQELYTACWSADATKATATTGSVGVFVDGVVVPGSYRFTGSGAGRNTIGACFSWVRTAATAQVVALYAVSGDTNSFAVQNAQLQLKITRLLPSR